MCKTGGPRCSTDTRRALTTARANLAEAQAAVRHGDRSDQAKVRVAEAQRLIDQALARFDSSPDGLAALSDLVTQEPTNTRARDRLAQGFATRLAEWQQHDQREGREPRTYVPMDVAGGKGVRVTAIHAAPQRRAEELHALNERARAAARAHGIDPATLTDRSTPVLYELHPSEAGRFRRQMLALREGNRFAASVYVYDEDEYATMRMLTTDDGKAGVAIKDDGDIVSVYSRRDGAHPRAANALIATAVGLGGSKLDCFDTVLPRLYAEEGFVETGRDSWNDEYRPDGWNEADYAAFNDGHPDVVYMTHDENRRLR